jgi:hypothetical protein
LSEEESESLMEYGIEYLFRLVYRWSPVTLEPIQVSLNPRATSAENEFQ